jgi:menaquinone-dependent protoporphyrinogen oxidase
MSRWLVIYASKHGSTTEVAAAIADRLRDDGHGVDLYSAGVAPTPAGYDAVVLGGSLYMTRWHPEARRYLRRNRNALGTVPLAVFALGPLTLAEKDVAGARAQLDAALAKFLELAPDRVAVFGGAVDPSVLRFPFSRMPATDARDWSDIRAWADDLSGLFDTAAPAAVG